MSRCCFSLKVVTTKASATADAFFFALTEA
jgi:hypothetical protein